MRPAALGVISAWLIPSMSHYGALSAASAAAGTLIALRVRERRPIWTVAALTAGALSGTVLLVLGGGACSASWASPTAPRGCASSCLPGLVILPLVELALPAGTAGQARSAGRPCRVAASSGPSEPGR